MDRRPIFEERAAGTAVAPAHESGPRGVPSDGARRYGRRSSALARRRNLRYRDVALARDVDHLAAGVGYVAAHPAFRVVVCNLEQPERAVVALRSLAEAAGVHLDLIARAVGTRCDVAVRAS